MPRSQIIPRWVKHNGVWQYRVIIPKDLGGGKRYRRPEIKEGMSKREVQEAIEAAKESALKLAANLLKQRNTGNIKFAALPSATQSAIMHAIEILGDGNGRDIVHAAEMWVKSKGKKQRTVKQAAEECVAAKKGADKRERSTYALENAFKRFMKGREDVNVRDIQTSEIERWVNASFEKVPGSGEWFPPSAKTRRSRQIDICTLFNFCDRRGYIDSDRNPVKALEEIDPDQSDPKSLTVDQCRTILLAAAREHNGNLLGIVALQLFAGIRPAETQRMFKAGMHRFGPIIPLQGKLTKTGDRRNVTVNPTLRAWLDYAEAHNGGMDRAWDSAKRMTKLREGVQPWVSDYFRHSFVSYHNQKFGWEETVRQAGHSLAMMLEAYMTLVTKAEAEAFWTLTPSNVLGETKPATPKNDGPSC